MKQIAEEVWEVEFRCPHSEWGWAVRFFYGLGMDAEVNEPPHLREEIAAMAMQVHDQYLGE